MNQFEIVLKSLSHNSTQQQQQQPLFTLFWQERRKEEKEQYRKQNGIRFIVIYIQVNELVCSSQSSKAFKLAAAYLQITKGTKKTNNNY